LKKIKISNFGGISKFLKLIIFGQILVDFDNFEQFWGDFVALAVVETLVEMGYLEHQATFAKLGAHMGLGNQVGA
jgi:hypothetical protein